MNHTDEQPLQGHAPQAQGPGPQEQQHTYSQQQQAYSQQQQAYSQQQQPQAYSQQQQQPQAYSQQQQQPCRQQQQPYRQQEARVWTAAPSKLELLGIVAIVLPFVVSMQSYSLLNSELKSYSNPPALIGGILAIVLGFISLARLGQTAPQKKVIRGFLALALFVGGGFQIARSEGAFFEKRDSDSYSETAIYVGSETANLPSRHSNRPTETVRACAVDEDTTLCVLARRLATEGCLGTSPDLCDELGVILIKGLGGPQDIEGALQASSKGCASKDAWACNNAGSVLFEAKYKIQDFEKASHYFTLGCDLNVGEPCYSQALLLNKTQGDRAETVAFLAKACLAEYPVAKACRHAILSSDEIGEKATQDWRVKILKQGCTLDDAFSCVGLGFFLGPSGAEALEAFEKGCQLGEAGGCSEAGLMLVKGLGVAVDEHKARKLGAMSCKKDDFRGCLILGYAAINGRGGPKDTEVGKAAYAHACKLGKEEACPLAK